MSENTTSLYPKEVMDELMKPYMDAYNHLAFLDLSENIANNEANFTTNWEEEYLITKEAKDPILRYELVNRKYEETPEARKIREEDRQNRRKWLDQEASKNSLVQSAIQENYVESTTLGMLEGLLSLMSTTDSSDTTTYSKPHTNTYVPHYTKPWTTAELAKVGAYSTKPSAAQKVYQDCYAKQDRAWHASIKSQSKWKK